MKPVQFNRLKIYIFLLLTFIAGTFKCLGESLDKLAENFESPPMEYRSYVWWHWMGSNFSKEGISKDLEAMKEAGIAGATIINLTSGVQESHVPIKNTPWPEQTYRSKAYWEAMRFAASEAKRLGLKLGLQNTPGYSTTGGPWITEESGMQKIVFSETKAEGEKHLKLTLPRPEGPVYKGWGSFGKQATFYRDIGVFAVPENAPGVEQILDITKHMDSSGELNWAAPKGSWRIYRIGHAPTMSNPHPLPDDLIGKAFESDKMNRAVAEFHWKNILEPLKEHLGEFLGDSFTHILIDSYEAGNQDWTPGFREEFIRTEGYDPLPWIALRLSGSKSDDLKKFSQDYKNAVSEMFIENGWKTARKMIHEAGLQFFFEPYHGPFNTSKSTSIPDIPMGEFWTHGKGRISDEIVAAAKKYGKKIVGAEAFTSRPEFSHYTEDPAFLKLSADGAFISGANLLFLHHWVHQPFNDKYQPGMGMGWWGTHFGRHQTWIKPGKAFFMYLARCQMLLQQGEFVSSSASTQHRSAPDFEIYFVANQSNAKKTFNLILKNAKQNPEFWDPEKGSIRMAAFSRDSQESAHVEFELEAGKSVFLIHPKKETKAYAKRRLPSIQVVKQSEEPVEGAWDVAFSPKLDKPFFLKIPELLDFASSENPSVKYFSGTAVYKKNVQIKSVDIAKNKRVLLELGELHDIAEVSVNGEPPIVLWSPPYTEDITGFLKSGTNELEISVTNNWANRLIGDEQHQADMEYAKDRGVKIGKPIASFPEWLLKGENRPTKERKTFSTWNYFRKDSPLYPAGLLGPVKIIRQEVKELP